MVLRSRGDKKAPAHVQAGMDHERIYTSYKQNSQGRILDGLGVAKSGLLIRPSGCREDSMNRRSLLLFSGYILLYKFWGMLRAFTSWRGRRPYLHAGEEGPVYVPLVTCLAHEAREGNLPRPPWQRQNKKKKNRTQQNMTDERRERISWRGCSGYPARDM